MTNCFKLTDCVMFLQCKHSRIPIMVASRNWAGYSWGNYIMELKRNVNHWVSAFCQFYSVINSNIINRLSCWIHDVTKRHEKQCYYRGHNRTVFRTNIADFYYGNSHRTTYYNPPREAGSLFWQAFPITMKFGTNVLGTKPMCIVRGFTPHPPF